MTNLLRNSALFFGLQVLYVLVQCDAQETAKPMTIDEWQKQRQVLFAKAATDSKDFTDDEVRELLYSVCLAEDGLDDEYHIALIKLVRLGESVYSLLSAEALKPHEDKWGKETGGSIAAGMIGFFDQSEGDKTEARRTTLMVLKKFPERYITCCRVMGNIGEPEDVPSLLPFMNQNLDAFRNVVHAVGKIAAVSQIPDIEKAVADWEKNNWEKLHVDPDKRAANWKNLCQPEVEKAIANIKERNVQWTPPPKEAAPAAKPAPPQVEPLPVP